MHSQPLVVLFSSVQLLNRVLTAVPWTAACQASLSITNSQSLLKLMSIELVIPSNHLIVCHPLLLLPSIFPSIRVFSNEPVLCIKWPKYWGFSFNISPSASTSVLPMTAIIIIIYLTSTCYNHIQCHQYHHHQCHCPHHCCDIKLSILFIFTHIFDFLSVLHYSINLLLLCDVSFL